MNGDSREEWAEGRLVRRVIALPPVQVDASGWDSDNPADQWAMGHAAPRIDPVPPRKVDCANWDTGPAWLELVVAFVPGSPPLHAFEQANRAIGLLQAGARLSYDAARSRPEGEAFVIALVPMERATEAQMASLAASLPPGSPPVRVARAA